jgi:hypothetical protein
MEQQREQLDAESNGTSQPRRSRGQATAAEMAAFFTRHNGGRRPRKHRQPDGKITYSMPMFRRWKPAPSRRRERPVSPCRPVRVRARQPRRASVRHRGSRRVTRAGPSSSDDPPDESDSNGLSPLLMGAGR